MKTLALQLQGYLDHLTIERGVAANTLSSYRRDLRRYSKHLEERGITDLAKVGEHDVSEFLVALRRGDPDSGIGEGGHRGVFLGAEVLHDHFLDMPELLVRLANRM